MTDERHAFAQIETWTSEAIASTRDPAKKYSPPPLEALSEALEGKLFLSVKVDTRDQQGRSLFGLTVRGPKEADPKVTRYMLPVHAALTRVLELGGAKIGLVRGSGGGIERYYFDLKIGSKVRTALHHFLFGVPSLGRLWERQETETGYRYLLPGNYLLGSGISRKRTLAALHDQLTNRPQQQVVSNPDSIVALLSSLLGLADHWHWGELERQSSTSDSERFLIDDPYG
ncbi:hypothetical protein ACKWRH_37770 [Bradyrhizobium sp. Pa8]|uniref:hypothetical protein n=1 Tax=Bradyrhizobium sp. Pa8 TaxID=3386552 RepID=UPI00403F3086